MPCALWVRWRRSGLFPSGSLRQPARAHGAPPGPVEVGRRGTRRAAGASVGKESWPAAQLSRRSWLRLGYVSRPVLPRSATWHLSSVLGLRACRTSCSSRSSPASCYAAWHARSPREGASPGRTGDRGRSDRGGGRHRARWVGSDVGAPEARRTMKNPSVTQNVCCAGPSV